MYIGERSILRLFWVAMLVLVVVGSLLPASSPELRIMNWIPDKLLHLTGYLVLGLLPAIRERPRTILAATVFVCLLGVVLEYAQRWEAAGRMFELTDMGANAIGAVTGVGIGWLLGGRSFRARPLSPGSATDTRTQSSGTAATSPRTHAPEPGSRGVPARRPSERQPVSRDRQEQARRDAAGRT